MRGVLNALLLLAATPAAGLRVAPMRHTCVRSSASMCASPELEPRRTVRVVTHNTELLSAQTAAVKKQEQKKGIDSVSLGGVTINFSHDMTQTFKWGGLILGLVLVKIIRKGKYAWTEEPNFKYIANTAAEEAELHEFQCENCGFTIFPARGREGKFFPDNYRCQQCDAPKSAFFDMTDLSDPRTVAAL